MKPCNLLAFAKNLFSFILITLYMHSPPLDARHTHEGHFLLDQDKLYLPFLMNNEDLVVDHVQENGYEVYGPPGTKNLLESLRLPYYELPHGQNLEPLLSDYPTPEEIEVELHRLHHQFPAITHILSIGETHEGRSIWAIKVSDRAEIDEIEPEVKYVANMHGDEIVGRELIMLLLKDLLDLYQKGDGPARLLVNNTELFFVPSLNPDGASKGHRGNARYVDLNRNFPDFTSLMNRGQWKVLREPETAGMMKFQQERHFALSANFHGGAMVVNYPWDCKRERHPLNDLVVSLAKSYAQRVKDIRESTSFPGGITNGFDWYQIRGSMQDWSEHYHGDLQFTLEVSHPKWPKYSQIPFYYRLHRDALFHFLGKVHQGGGFRFSSSSLPPIAQNERISGNVEIKRMTSTPTTLSLGVFPFAGGEFYKVLEKGRYQFTVYVDGEKGKRPPSPILFQVQIEDDKIFEDGNYKTLHWNDRQQRWELITNPIQSPFLVHKRWKIPSLSPVAPTIFGPFEPPSSWPIADAP